MTRFSLSLPSSSLSTSYGHHTQQRVTNSVAVTSLPKSFFHPLILDVLQRHFTSYGEINRWVPLPGFGRIIVVYQYEQDAESAKLRSDPIILKQTHDRSEVILRVYRADPNPLITNAFPFSIPSSNYLRPPEIDKNFLISPPGSPPVGWEQLKESPPNAAPLAGDLMNALRKLQLSQRRSSVEVLLDPMESDGCGVGVYVEDCDFVLDEDGVEEVREEDWVYEKASPARTIWKPIPTSLPPMMA